MNKMKGILRRVVTLALTVTMLLPNAAITASAAATCPAEVEVGTYKGKGYYYTGTVYGAPIEVNFDTAGDYIANVKSSSSDLKVFVVVNYQSRKLGRIGVLTTKLGKYQVSFDIYSKNGVKKESKNVNVIVYDLNKTIDPVKKITYAGKDSIYGSDNIYDVAKSGKLKVTMKKGYKLKSIEIGKIDPKDNKIKFKKFKNGKKVTLSTYAPKYDRNYSWCQGYIANMYSVTYVKINYYNTKKKRNETTMKYIYRLVNWNK